MEGDSVALSNFSPENLYNKIIKPLAEGTARNLEQKSVTIELRPNNTDPQINAKFSAALKEIARGQGGLPNSNLKIVGNIIHLDVGFNIPEMKTVFNKLDSQHFHLSSEYSKIISKYLREEINSQRLSSYFIIKADGSEVPSKELMHIFEYRPFPWGYRKTEITKQLKENGKLAQDMALAVGEIRSQIFDLLNDGKTSAELRYAVEETLNDYFNNGSEWYYDFFSGEALSSNIKGSLGEFQAVLFGNYLKRLFPSARKNVTSSLETRLRKDETAAKGEKLKVDANWIIGNSTFGVQVKNYGVSDGLLQRDIEVNQHPTDFSKYLNAASADDLCYYLANCAFTQKARTANKTITEELEKFIRTNLAGEALRLSTKTGIPDVVNFYIIGGKYLVPGSAILQHYYSENGDNDGKVEIGFPEPIFEGDERFFGTKYVKKRKKKGDEKEQRLLDKLGNPKIIKYWDYNLESGYWEPGNDNQNEYNRLIQKSISIRTKFNGIKLSGYAFY